MTNWVQVSQATFQQVQVGKTYMFDGRKGRVMSKSENSGQTNAAGWGMGSPMVKVQWR